MIKSKAAKTAEKTTAKTASFKERRLVLLNSKDNNIDSMKMRDQINQEFAKQSISTSNKPVLAAIIKSQLQQNIVLTTTEDFNADFLIQHEQIWSKFFKFSKFRKDFTWFKVVAHMISTDVFNSAKGLDLLKQEIETFNGIHPIDVKWLTNSQNRLQKKHGSVVIAFNTQTAAQKALKRLLIAGMLVKTDVYIDNKTTEQCRRCQQFGHATNTCKNTTACQFCAGIHPTRLHVCNICNTIGEICTHTIFKCVNCNKSHAANDKECEFAINILASKQLNLNINSAESDSSSVLAPNSITEMDY